MGDPFDATQIAFLERLGLSADMVRRHVFLPSHVEDAVLRIELRQPGDGDPEVFEAPPSGILYRLDVDALSEGLHALLSPCVAGYALQLRRYGKVLLNRQFGWARTPPDGGLGWTADAQMHVASVSKLITAMALTKLLHSRNISPDARIAPWLPPHWARGPGVDAITFRQLLTHRSGLVMVNEPGPADYGFMKAQIAVGVVAGPGYRNINYSLCRLLISTIDAPYLFQFVGANATDQYWDLTTIRYYERYVRENVFDPAGVASSHQHEADDALAYPIPVASPGWDSGDLATIAGAGGWHLSAYDLLRVMAAFRRWNVIVDPGRAQTMLDRGFGIDVRRDTTLGRIYAKGGFWGKDNGTYVEQTCVFFLPKGMELVVLANSPFCSANRGFITELLDVIEASIRLRVLTVAAAAVTFVTLVGGLLTKASARAASR